MNLGLFEDAATEHLYPLTWLRSATELRCGRDTLLDKLRHHVPGHLVQLWLRPVVEPAVRERITLAAPQDNAPWAIFNARAFVTGDVTPPATGTCWRLGNGDVLAVGVKPNDVERLSPELFMDPAALEEWLADYKPATPPDTVRLVHHPWELALGNAAELARQCQDGGAHLGRIDPGVHMLHPERIHIAADARIKPGAVLDAEDGPIHIDRDVTVESLAVIQGPCYLGPGSVVRPGAALRGGVTLGPICKVGGEIEATIFQGYSNKQHDGFLGHSFVGEWVNLGADTVTSDLKNTYGSIRVFLNGVGVESGQRFVGSMIGDHSKTGIGTILPTGCVVGVAANVFTRRPVPKFVPSFAWLTDDGLTEYRVDKAVQIAQIVMGRRDLEFSPAARHALEQTAHLARKVEAPGWEG